MNQYIKEKRRLWNLWKMDGSKENCLAAKKCAKRAVYNTKMVAQEIRFAKMNKESLQIS